MASVNGDKYRVRAGPLRQNRGGAGTSFFIVAPPNVKPPRRGASEAMQRAIQPLAGPLIGGLLMLASASWAGPLVEVEGDGTQLVDMAPSLHVNSAVPPTAAAAAEPAASAGSLALEIIKEAGAGSHSAEPPPHAKARSGAVNAATRNDARTSSNEDGLTLRELGKSAILWAKAKLSWGDGDADTQKSVGPESPYATNPSTSMLIDDAGGNSSEVNRHRIPDASDAQSYDAATTTSSAGVTLRGPNDDLVHAAIQFVREVMAHPMTWLILVLVVVGSLVAKKMDRRPTK